MPYGVFVYSLPEILSMRRRDKNTFSIHAHPHEHAIVEKMREMFHHHNPYSLFTDFIEMSAIALSSRFDWAQRDRREKRYLEIEKRYTVEERKKIAHMFAELMLCYMDRTEALGSPGLGGKYPVDNEGDVLGKIFSALEIGNDRLGQYFTPGCVQRFMGMMAMPEEADIREMLREHGFITVSEPSCGAGGMIIAAAETFHNLGFNYPTQFHATCVDKDRLCAHMTYLQLSLRGIPAIVVHGNSLTLEEWETWYTPPHIFLGWSAKLRRRREREKAQEALQQAEALLYSATQPGPPEAPTAREPRHARKSRSSQAASAAPAR